MWKILLLGAFLSATSSRLMGPIAKLTVNYLDHCRDEPISDIVFNIGSKAVLSEENKEFFGNFTFNVTIDDTITGESSTSKWDTGWKELYRKKFNLCDNLTTYFSKFWKRFLASVSPPLEFGCYVQPGFYTFDHFQPEMDDFDIGNYYYGTIRRKIKYFKDDRVILCAEVEYTIQGQ